MQALSMGSYVMASLLLKMGSGFSFRDTDLKGNNSLHYILRDKWLAMFGTPKSFSKFLKILGIESEKMCTGFFQPKSPWESPLDGTQILYPKWYLLTLISLLCQCGKT